LKSVAAILAPPLLCAGLLAGIGWEKSTHVKPQDARAYHARVKAAIAAMNYTIGDGNSGMWFGQNIDQPKAAVELLRPNIILSRRYTNTSDQDKFRTRICDVLIVQCWNSRDMVGHYPENCYHNTGETLVEKRPRKWQIGERQIIGTEYIFERYSRGQPLRRCVYNFLVVPGEGPLRGIVPDIKAVNKAAEDYQWRHFGAAQFQFVFQANEVDSREERDRIFKTLMGSNMGVFDALENVNVNDKLS
jgi:hypothetical protein